MLERHAIVVALRDRFGVSDNLSAALSLRLVQSEIGIPKKRLPRRTIHGGNRVAYAGFAAIVSRIDHEWAGKNCEDSSSRSIDFRNIGSSQQHQKFISPDPGNLIAWTD